MLSARVRCYIRLSPIKACKRHCGLCHISGDFLALLVALDVSREANMGKVVLVGAAFSVFGALAILSAFVAPFGAVVPF